MTRSHLEREMLFDYAAGSLAEAPSLVAATHLAYCKTCRDELAALEHVGGELLAQAEAAPVAGDALARTLARLERPEPEIASEPILDAASRSVMPGPLRRFVGRNLDQLKWRRVGPRIEEAVLATASPEFKTSLLRIAAGAAVPVHTHGGREYTLVLKGGIIDDGMEYRQGDVMAMDETHEHRPVATPDEECICLAVLDAPVRLTGRFTRFLNPFLRH